MDPDNNIVNQLRITEGTFWVFRDFLICSYGVSPLVTVELLLMVNQSYFQGSTVAYT